MYRRHNERYHQILHNIFVLSMKLNFSVFRQWFRYIFCFIVIFASFLYYIVYVIALSFFIPVFSLKDFFSYFIPILFYLFKLKKKKIEKKVEGKNYKNNKYYENINCKKNLVLPIIIVSAVTVKKRTFRIRQSGTNSN